MALSDDIQALRDEVLVELIGAYDYYGETTIAWQMVQSVIMSGNEINIRNHTTGTITTQVKLATKARGYVASQLVEATFQQFVSIFENFYFDLLRLWLTAYPQSLGKRMVDFRTILELPDKDAITGLVVRKELNEILYGRPTEWFAYLEEKVRLGCPTSDEIHRIAEVKAVRDILIHNKGIANKIYESKAGKFAQFQDGERVKISESYHRETWELFRKVVMDVSDAAIAKSS